MCVTATPAPLIAVGQGRDGSELSSQIAGRHASLYAGPHAPPKPTVETNAKTVCSDLLRIGNDECVRDASARVDALLSLSLLIERLTGEMLAAPDRIAAGHLADQVRHVLAQHLVAARAELSSFED